MRAVRVLAVLVSVALNHGLPGDLTAQDAAAVPTVQKVKNFVEIDGTGPMELKGYGLMIGLNGTGDSPGGETETLIRNLLSQHSGRIIGKIVLKNCAAVLVTARMQPFQGVGTTIDVRVSSAGDAKSLVGGELLMTPLRNAVPLVEKAEGGEIVWAVAQGRIVVESDGRTGNPISGHIYNGAAVKTALHGEFVKQDREGTKYVTLNLRRPDFNLASRLADTLNSVLFPYPSAGRQTRFFPLASVRDSGSVQVRLLSRQQWTEKGMIGEYPGFDSEPVLFVDRLLDVDVAIPAVPRKAIVYITDKSISMSAEVLVRPGYVRIGNTEVGRDRESTLREILDMASKVATPALNVEIVRALDAAGLLEAEVRTQ